MNPDDFNKYYPPVPVRPVPMEARRALVIEAAIRWWEAQRPEGWTEDVHLQYPEAGSTGRDAFLLSDAVASLVSGQRVDTGTGARRRRLTLEEAEAGALPEPMTREEWAAMAAASTPAPVPAPTPEPAPEPAPPTAAAAKPRDRTPRTVVSPSPQLRALTLLAAGMSVYRVAAVMDLPFDVVHRWSVDARRAAKESTAA